MTTASEDRTLVLVRHAEAADGPGMDDVDRPLTERGREEAQQLGRWLHGHGLDCDEVLVSPSQRTRETVAEVAEAGCSEAEVQVDRRLYDARADDLLACIREATSDASVLVVVAHAPAIPAVVSLLADGEGDEEAHEALSRGYATASAAVLSYQGRWSDIGPATSSLDTFWTPGNSSES